jgi:hypothetical protein
LVFGPGATESRYPGSLSENSRWDWIDLRSFSRWRVHIFTGTLDNGLAKLIASFYEIPDRFLPLLHREERRRRHRTIVVFVGVGLLVAAVTTGSVVWGLRERADRLCQVARAAADEFGRDRVHYYEMRDFGLEKEWQREADELQNGIQKYCSH